METQHVCVNCNHEIAMNFCPNCGQKKFKRIDQKYLKDEIQYSILHTNKGFFYTIKNLIKNPGKTAREFIDGNRVNHYKPILLAFVLSGFSTFISYKVLHMEGVMSDYLKQQMGESAVDMSGPMSAVYSYMSILLLLLLPIFAFFTKIVFRKWGHNYYEHIVMNAFFYSFYCLFCIILIYPVLYFFRHNSSGFMAITSVSVFAAPFFLVWFYKGFYPERSTGKISLHIALFCILVFIAYILSIFLVGVIATAYFYLKGGTL